MVRLPEKSLVRRAESGSGDTWSLEVDSGFWVQGGCRLLLFQVVLGVAIGVGSAVAVGARVGIGEHRHWTTSLLAELSF